MQEKIRYTEILLPSEEPFSNYGVNDSISLAPLSLVNIFIGANNCGKSRLLRAIFSLNEFSYNTNKYSNELFYLLIERFNKEFKEAFKNGIIAIDDISINRIEKFLSSQEKDFISSKNPIFKLFFELLNNLRQLENKFINQDFDDFYEINYNDENLIRKSYYELKNETVTISRVIEVINKFNEEFNNIISRLNKSNIDLFSTNLDDKWYYIPMLRGMRPLLDNRSGELADINVYQKRTQKDYFENFSSAKMQIFTGLELYQTLKEKLLGEPKERDEVKGFENFLSESFFGNKQVTLIPREKDPKVVHIKIGDEDQLPIYHLGDGLQNLIICTFNIFMEKSRCLFFIEEPDMFMHPSMQRSFLEVLSKYDHHQYFITSHSNHFLDMTIDFDNISVFHFSKHEDTQPQFHIRPSSPRDRQILLDLGVRNSAVFITNATIWVEGKTDRLYLKAYMKKYIDELKEDIDRMAENNSDLKKNLEKRYIELNKLKEDYHYSFVEYQGANLTHWSFDPDEKETEDIKASYVCAHAFLLADGDVATKGERKKIYTDMLGDDRFHLLEVKEIENLIPVEILQKVVAEKFKEYEGNIENIKYEDYAKLDTPIGKYLDLLLKSIPEGKTVFAAINRSKTKSEGTGTIKSKGTFCDDAIKFMQNPEWALTDELKAICKKIFDHIITQNKNS